MYVCEKTMKIPIKLFTVNWDDFRLPGDFGQAIVYQKKC